jgi:hypothetical protein
MSNAIRVIDFKDIDGLVYTGRDRGERLRSEFKLDELDAAGEVVEVDIPDNAYTISSSFFLGLFGPSVVGAGSKEAFLRRYHFKAPDFLNEVMDTYVSRALQNRNLFA